MDYIKQNIKYLREQKNISQDELAKELGVTRDNIASYERGSQPKVEILNKIVNYFHIDLETLINRDLSKPEEVNNVQESQGVYKVKQYRKSSKQKDQEIPLYDLDASAGIMYLFNERRGNIIDRIHIPNLAPSDGALFITGDSMYPLIKAGDFVAYKQLPIEKSSIIWGEIYLIAVDMGGMTTLLVKYIQKSDASEEHIKLVSYNENHQPMDIHLSKVKALAFVTGSFRYHTMA